MTTPIFNPLKAINSVLYVVSKLKKSDMHKISKILYFADMVHLSTYGRSITGDTYIAMEYGPVPSAIYDIFKSLRGDGASAYTEMAASAIRIKNRFIVNALQEADLKYLSKTDIQVIDDVILAFGEHSWADIVEISHQYAWSNTPLNAPISVEKMLIESHQEQEYISYVTQFINNQKLAM